MTRKIAIIGGSGLDDFAVIEQCQPVTINTPYGIHASGIKQGRLNGVDCVFMPRHGQQHELPPHRVNYRANIHALKQLGVTSVIAINVVGGIAANMVPKALVVPHQIIDYTYGREHTFFDGKDYSDDLNTSNTVEHIDFSYPYSPKLRQQLLHFLEQQNIDVIAKGVYGCTQGPRLETSAEINRLRQDNCDIVGMTAMPEAALARERHIEYVSLCLVVNWAAGVTEEVLNIDEIMKTCSQGIDKVKKLLPSLCSSLN